MVVDLYLVYQFLKRLAMPFEKWEAYEKGIIDADGEILKNSRQRRAEGVKGAFTKFDLLVLKIKKLLEKVPGGQSKLGSYAAALWFIKEYAEHGDENMLTEDALHKYMQLAEENTMSVGSGAVSGMGYNGPDDLGFNKKQMEKYKKKNRKLLLRRFRDTWKNNGGR